MSDFASRDCFPTTNEIESESNGEKDGQTSAATKVGLSVMSVSLVRMSVGRSARRRKRRISSLKKTNLKSELQNIHPTLSRTGNKNERGEQGGDSKEQPEKHPLEQCLYFRRS